MNYRKHNVNVAVAVADAVVRGSIKPADILRCRVQILIVLEIVKTVRGDRIDVDTFSSLVLLRRLVAWIMRFANNLLIRAVWHQNFPRDLQ